MFVGEEEGTEEGVVKQGLNDDRHVARLAQIFEATSRQAS